MNPELTRGREGSIALRTLYRLELVPQSQWVEVPQYQEVNGDHLYSVDGFQTVLDLSGKQFVVRLENRTLLSPDIMRGQPSVFTSPYRIRVVKHEGEKPVHIDYHFDRATPEGVCAHYLYETLTEKVRFLRENKEDRAQDRLERDFTDAIKASAS